MIHTHSSSSKYGFHTLIWDCKYACVQNIAYYDAMVTDWDFVALLLFGFLYNVYKPGILIKHRSLQRLALILRDPTDWSAYSCLAREFMFFD